MKKNLTKNLILFVLIILLAFCTLSLVNITSVHAIEGGEALSVEPIDMNSYSVAYDFLSIEVEKSYWVFPWYWDWDIKLTNLNSFAVNVTYNSRLCHEGHAKTFTGLNDTSDITIPGNSSKTVRVTNNGNAGYVVAAINVTTENNKKYKYISYVDGLKYEDNVGSTNKIKISIIEE